MNKLLLIATAFITVGGAAVDDAAACNLRYPNFELTGFPISRHQVALLGGTNVVEQSATPQLTLAGMPASPHQIAVLTPRMKAPKLVQASADASSATLGLAPRQFRSVDVAALAACVPE